MNIHVRLCEMGVLSLIFFFVKQKTAYEMRISDWSSDVCSSDLQACTACADACLGEQMVQQLTQCVRLNQDCADACAATGAVATRRTGSNEQLMGSIDRKSVV